MGSFDKLVLWLFGDRKKARDVAERHHATVTANLPTGLEGDAQDGMDGMLYGGVIWPVEPGTHGAKAFLSAWCFLAYYDATKKEAYMLDDLDGTRHPGARPLKVGKDLKIQSGEKRSGRGMVIRSAEEGEAGQLKNVFQHYEPNLVAHHLPENQPDNSSQVCDPDADGRQGGLHYPLRVREWVRKFCSGASQAVKEKLFAPLLNMRLKNGDGTDAGGGATFARGEAALSDEAKGPLACADDGNHRLGITDEATIHQGGNAIDVLYGPVSGGLYMPEEVIDTPWAPGSYGPFITRVEKRPDPAAKHKNFCKKDVPGQLKWLNYDTFREFPPAFPPPPDTPPDQPPPETPPGRPPAMLVPPESPIPPTTGTPYEIESPSQYGHPMPSIPDGPPEAEGEPNAANDNARDAFWLNRFGHKEDAWHRTPITGHRFTVPEYQFSEARTSGERWPTVKETHELIEYEPDGSVRARIAATGPGSTVEAPAWARPWHIFKALWQTAWRESQNLLLIMAGKNSAGVTVDGRAGLGARVPNSPFVASGQEWRLGFDGSGGITEPDLHLYPKTTTGAEGADTGAAKLVIHEDVHITGAVTSDVTTFGSGDVTAASNIGDNLIAKGDGAGKGVQNSDLALDDPSGNETRVRVVGDNALVFETAGTVGTARGIKIDSGVGATGGAITIGTNNAESVTIGRSGKNTAVGGTLSSGAHTITQATEQADAETIRTTLDTSYKHEWQHKTDRIALTGGAPDTWAITPVADGNYTIYAEATFRCLTSGGGGGDPAVNATAVRVSVRSYKVVGGTVSQIGTQTDYHSASDANMGAASLTLQMNMGATVMEVVVDGLAGNTFEVTRVLRISESTT